MTFSRIRLLAYTKVCEEVKVQMCDGPKGKSHIITNHKEKHFSLDSIRVAVSEWLRRLTRNQLCLHAQVRVLSATNFFNLFASIFHFLNEANGFFETFSNF
jgi:hypothetical protein